MSLTPEQRSVLRTIIRVGKQMGASPKVMKAAVETGIVEANLTNPKAATDHDSLGAFQQRPSQGWGTPAQVTNVEHAARSFFQRAIPIHHQYGTAGALAQAVQRSAFPARYDQAGGRAAGLLGGVQKSAGITGGLAAAATPSNAGAVDQARRQAVAGWLLGGSNDPMRLASGVNFAESQVPAAPKAPRAAAATGSVRHADPANAPAGVATFEGKQVAAWVAPALAYARARGWKGTVTSGLRSYADQQRIYDSGVRPAARPGTSNHEGTQYPRGAVDVSDPQGLARILARSPYAGKLVYAGAKDPVHFSHPHGGRY